MTITLDILDATWQAVERMAERFHLTPKERLEKLIEIAHSYEEKHPRRESAEELDRRLDEMARQQGIDPDAGNPLAWVLDAHRLGGVK